MQWRHFDGDLQQCHAHHSPNTVLYQDFCARLVTSFTELFKNHEATVQKQIRNLAGNSAVEKWIELRNVYVNLPWRMSCTYMAIMSGEDIASHAYDGLALRSRRGSSSRLTQRRHGYDSSPFVEVLKQ
jgi:hypothetical protein